MRLLGESTGDAPGSRLHAEPTPLEPSGVARASGVCSSSDDWLAPPIAEGVEAAAPRTRLQHADGEASSSRLPGDPALELAASADVAPGSGVRVASIGSSDSGAMGEESSSRLEGPAEGEREGER